MNKKILAVLAPVLLALAGLLYAGAVQTGYQATRGTASTAVPLYGDGVTAVSSAAWSSPVTPYYTRGNSKIGVAITNTNAGANVEVTMGLYHRDEAAGTYTFLGLSDQKTIAISSAEESAAGYYTHEDAIQFETNGANAFDLRVTGLPSPGADEVDIRVWGVGVSPTLVAAPAAE